MSISPQFIYLMIWFIFGLLNVKTWDLGADAWLKNKRNRTKLQANWSFLGTTIGHSSCYGRLKQPSDFCTKCVVSCVTWVSWLRLRRGSKCWVVDAILPYNNVLEDMYMKIWMIWFTCGILMRWLLNNYIIMNLRIVMCGRGMRQIIVIKYYEELNNICNVDVIVWLFTNEYIILGVLRRWTYWRCTLSEVGLVVNDHTCIFLLSSYILVYELRFGGELWFKSGDCERVVHFSNGISEALLIQY